MTGMPLLAAAKALGLDVTTLRHHVRNGCPVVRKGRRGPGGSALVDLEQVRAWRRGTAAEGLSLEAVLDQAATALLASLQKDRCDIRAGCSRDDAAAVLLVAWEAIYRSFGKTYPFDQQPGPIRELMREL